MRPEILEGHSPSHTASMRSWAAWARGPAIQAVDQGTDVYLDIRGLTKTAGLAIDILRVAYGAGLLGPTDYVGACQIIREER